MLMRIRRTTACCMLSLHLAGGVNPAHAAPPSNSGEIVVAATLSEPLDPHRTTIFCLTFQAAWNALADRFIHGDIKLEGSPVHADLLNAERKTPINLPEEFFFHSAVKGPSGLKTMNKALRSRFGADAPQLDDELDNSDIVAYAYLKRDLPFAHKFLRKEGFSFTADGTTTNVRAFGVTSNSPRTGVKIEALREQVIAYRYFNDSSFIVFLSPKDRSDGIVLARIPPGRTLGDTLTRAQEAIDEVQYEALPTLQGGETFLAPALRFQMDHSFIELIRKRLLNPGWQGYFIDEAIQKVDFRLDETGASIRSNAKIELKLGGPPRKHRQFVFDGPFLIYIKRADQEQPYFVAWIGDTSAMQIGKSG